MPNYVDLDGNYLSPRELAARGAAAFVVVLLVAAGLYVKSSRLLNHGVHIVAELRNVGDGLPVRSDVKYRGVLVGSVDSIVPATGNQPNQVHLRLKREYAGSIPATVTARVVPSNVFAMSSVQLVEQGPGAPIAAIYGVIVTVVSCEKGLSARGGSAGVASSVNAAVVESVLVLMMVNVVVSELHIVLFPRTGL